MLKLCRARMLSWIAALFRSLGRYSRIIGRTTLTNTYGAAKDIPSLTGDLGPKDLTKFNGFPYQVSLWFIRFSELLWLAVSDSSRDIMIDAWAWATRTVTYQFALDASPSWSPNNFGIHWWCGDLLRLTVEEEETCRQIVLMVQRTHVV